MAVIQRRQSDDPPEHEPRWSEPYICALIGRQFLRSSYAVLVPNCNWTGYECDVLAVSKCLRVVDIEIKVSRADFKADAKKNKWWRRHPGTYCPELRRFVGGNSEHRPWPPRVWKHYFAMPESIWRDDMRADLPSPNCGVLLLRATPSGAHQVTCVKRAKPNREADKISAADAVCLARLASLRMLDAFQSMEGMRA